MVNGEWYRCAKDVLSTMCVDIAPNALPSFKTMYPLVKTTASLLFRVLRCLVHEHLHRKLIKTNTVRPKPVLNAWPNVTIPGMIFFMVRDNIFMINLNTSAMSGKVIMGFRHWSFVSGKVKRQC